MRTRPEYLMVMVNLVWRDNGIVFTQENSLVLEGYTLKLWRIKCPDVQSTYNLPYDASAKMLRQHVNNC